jgi:ABC-type uncharacterized transport system substrate-binding protein
MKQKAKVLKVTRAEMVRNAIMEYLFRFDEAMDAQLLMDAIKKNEGTKSLQKIAKEMGLS